MYNFVALDWFEESNAVQNEQTEKHIFVKSYIVILHIYVL